jgi:hypothetical protein
MVYAPIDVARLFRAALCSMRRQLERETGRLPSPGEAFGAMLEHATQAWAPERRRPSELAVFERDGWRCTVPGCSSYRNLQDHHNRVPLQGRLGRTLQPHDALRLAPPARVRRPGPTGRHGPAQALPRHGYASGEGRDRVHRTRQRLFATVLRSEACAGGAASCPIEQRPTCAAGR